MGAFAAQVIILGQFSILVMFDGPLGGWAQACSPGFLDKYGFTI